MTGKTLTEHYDNKYSPESTMPSIDLIRAVEKPTSRFEAVIKYFPMNFKGLRRNLVDKRIMIKKIDVDELSYDELGKYDAIIMIALIEHLVNPLGAMQRVKELLKPGGFVYIDTPNIAKYTRRLKLLFGRFPSTASMDEGLRTYSGEPSDLYDEGHLHYFTYRSLSLMLTERCGFTQVIELGYPCGKTHFGKGAQNFLARVYPHLFSEIVVLAYM